MSYTNRFSGNNFSGGNFGNFDYGQTRMAGDAFQPSYDDPTDNNQFVMNQQEHVKNQQTKDTQDWTTYQSDNTVESSTYHDTSGGGNSGGGGNNGGSTFNTTNNTTNTTNTSTTTNNITNSVDIDQEIDQESKAEYNMGNYDQNNSFNNNVLSDYAEMNVFQNQYGGDVKAINIAYNGEGAQTKATPVSDLTIAGAYEVSDSPAKTASFIGKYGDLNRANQSSYGNTGVKVANKYMDMGRANQAIDVGAMDQRVNTRPLYHQAQSRVEGAYTFGDRYANQAPNWQDVNNQDDNYGIDPNIQDKVFGNNDDDDWIE